MISLCFSTRGRPEVFKRMCLSALDSAAKPDEIEFITYRDTDDVPYEFVGNHKEIIAKRFTHSNTEMTNECVKLATGPIYMFLADDVEFKTKDWDIRVQEAFGKYPDRIVLICPDNENWKVWNYGTLGFIHKNWIDTLGYLHCPHPDAKSGDQWLNEVAVALDRRVHLQDVVVEHINIHDHVHREKNQRGRDQQYTKRYHLPEMVELRNSEINKLKNFIK